MAVKEWTIYAPRLPADPCARSELICSFVLLTPGEHKRIANVHTMRDTPTPKQTLQNHHPQITSPPWSERKASRYECSFRTYYLIDQARGGRDTERNKGDSNKKIEGTNIRLIKTMSDDCGAKTPVAAASIRDHALRFNAIARKVTHGAFERRDIQNKPLHRIWRKLEIACRKRNKDLPRHHQETVHVFRSTSGCNCWSAPPKDQINHMCHTCVFIWFVVERFFF